MILFALALATAAAGRAPDDSAIELDLRCAAVIAMTIGQQGKDAPSGLTAGMMYFVGRIDARAPGYDLEANMRRLVGSANAGATLAADRPRCAAILKERGTYLAEMGARMQAGGAH